MTSAQKAYEISLSILANDSMTYILGDWARKVKTLFEYEVALGRCARADDKTLGAALPYLTSYHYRVSTGENSYYPPPERSGLDEIICHFNDDMAKINSYFDFDVVLAAITNARTVAELLDLPPGMTTRVDPPVLKARETLVIRGDETEIVTAKAAEIPANHPRYLCDIHPTETSYSENPGHGSATLPYRKVRIAELALWAKARTIFAERKRWSVLVIGSVGGIHRAHLWAYLASDDRVQSITLVDPKEVPKMEGKLRCLKKTIRGAPDLLGLMAQHPADAHLIFWDVCSDRTNEAVVLKDLELLRRVFSDPKHPIPALVSLKVRPAFSLQSTIYPICPGTKLHLQPWIRPKTGETRMIVNLEKKKLRWLEGDDAIKATLDYERRINTWTSTFITPHTTSGNCSCTFDILEEMTIVQFPKKQREHLRRLLDQSETPVETELPVQKTTEPEPPTSTITHLPETPIVLRFVAAHGFAGKTTFSKEFRKNGLPLTKKELAASGAQDLAIWDIDSLVSDRVEEVAQARKDYLTAMKKDWKSFNKVRDVACRKAIVRIMTSGWTMSYLIILCHSPSDPERWFGSGYKCSALVSIPEDLFEERLRLAARTPARASHARHCRRNNEVIARRGKIPVYLDVSAAVLGVLKTDYTDPGERVVGRSVSAHLPEQQPELADCPDSPTVDGPVEGGRPRVIISSNYGEPQPWDNTYPWGILNAEITA